MHVNEITGRIIDSAIKVHTVLGPGLMENTYANCLTYELRKRGHLVAAEIMLPVKYEEVQIDAGYRIDLLVEEQVILELKSVEKLLPIHEAQLLTYLKLSRLKVGILLNFNVVRMKDGIKRMVSNF